MDKRKGIILAIVLFLIVGLGTFVFAGGSEGQDNAINPSGDGEDPITPPTSGEEGTDPAGDGESEGEGGSEGSNPAGGYVDNDDDNEQTSQDNQDDVADNNQSTDNDQNQDDNNNDDDNGQGNADDTAYQQALALIAYLEDQIAKAEVRKTLDDAADYRDLNKVADKIAALTDGEDKTDLANRLAAINTILDDKVGPAIDGLPTSKLTNQIVSLSVSEEGVTVTLNGDAVTLDDIKNLSKDGTYKVVVTDKALNSTTAEFTVDRTPIGISHLYILNHTYHLDSNYTDKHYTVIGNDQELYVELVLEEEFASTPVITVGDGEGVEMTCGTASWDDTLYKCDAFVTISEDMNFENGDAITFDITGVKDAAGNELDIDESLIVETDKYGEVIYDKQAPSVVWLYTLNADDDENLQVIGDGLDLLVELRVDEELLEDPTITIGGYTATLTRRDDSKGRFIYEKRITIDEKLMGLVHNEVIPFVITGTDAAGNEFKFTKATTNTDAGYGEVVYDGSAPKYKSLGVLNVTHLRLNNKGASESLTVANIGDEVRVLVRFDEKLDTLPTLVIGDASAEMTLMKSSAEYTYSADITLTADMFDEDGLVDFQVSGYADAVGNVGEVLDVDDIKGYEDYSGVTLDTTAPTVKFANTHGQKYYNLDYITVTITENNLSEVYYTWGGSNKYSNATNLVSEDLITDNGDGTYTVKVPTVEGRKKLSIKAVDVAGNIYTGYSTSGWYNIDKTAAQVTVDYEPTTDTNGIVTVTLTGNENITIADNTWTKVSSTVYTKEYSENTDETVIVKDRAGNVTEVNVTITNIDTTEPVVTFANTHGQKYYNLDYITVTITENNLSEVYYTWGGSNKYSNATNLVSEDLITDNGDGTYTVKVPTVEGRKKLSIKAVDVAGNIYTGYSTSGWYNIDKTAAQVTVDYEPTTDTNGIVTVTLTGNENITIADNTWTKVSSTVYTKEYSENTDETVIVKDRAGNETEVNVSFTNIDKSAPTFDNLVDGISDYSVSLVVTDDSFDYIELKNTTTNQLIKESRNWTTFGGNEYVGTWTAQVFDKAGNSSDIFTFTIKPLVASAEINGEKVNFSTYQELFAAIPDSTETAITIENDTAENIVIPANKVVSIDLGNNTLSGDRVITNNGTITNISNGTIESTGYGITNNGTITTINNVSINSDNKGIYNNGTINTVKDCEIEARFNPIHLVNNSSIALLENNEIIGHYQSGIYVTNNASISEIASGYYTTYGDRPSSGKSIAGFALYIDSSAKVELISGGTFKGNKAAVANYGTIESITGGNFEEKYTDNDWDPSKTFLYNGKVLSISGGTFFTYSDANSGIFWGKYTLADGYEFVKIDDNHYKVELN